MLEDENVAANIFIEPKDGGVTDEDSGEEDGGGFLSNLSGEQLDAPAKLFISTQKCCSEETSSHSPETFSCSTSQPNITNSIPKPDESEKLRKSSYQTLKWKKNKSFPEKNMLFPGADYSKYRDFSAAELFELFFDDDLFDLLVQQSIL